MYVAAHCDSLMAIARVARRPRETELRQGRDGARARGERGEPRRTTGGRDRTWPIRNVGRGRESSLERCGGADSDDGSATGRRVVQRGGLRTPGTECVTLATLGV